MNKLIIDCSAGMSVYLCKGKQVLSKVDENQKKHTDELLVVVDELLNVSGLKMSDVDVIGVCIGPGSFTGVRVAISICKGLAIGSGAKVAVVSNFDLFKCDDENHFVVLEGFSDYVYVRKVDGDLVQDSCVSTSEFAGEFKEKYLNYKIIADNEKTQKRLKTFEINTNIVEKQTISAINEKIEANNFIELNEISPVYLRASQAEIERNKRLGGGV